MTNDAKPLGMFPNLQKGQNEKDRGMFPNILSRGYGFEPTPEEMEQARERARFAKNVYMTGYHTNTFDLSDPEQVEKYNELRTKIYEKAKMGELVIHKLEHMQINDGKPRWMVHIEYSEYRFEKVDRTEQQEDNEQ